LLFFFAVLLPFVVNKDYHYWTNKAAACKNSRWSSIQCDQRNYFMLEPWPPGAPYRNQCCRSQTDCTWTVSGISHCALYDNKWLYDGCYVTSIVKRRHVISVSTSCVGHRRIISQLSYCSCSSCMWMPSVTLDWVSCPLSSLTHCPRTAAPAAPEQDIFSGR